MKYLILLSLVLVACNKSEETTVTETRVVKCATKPKKDRPKHEHNETEPDEETPAQPVTVIVEVDNEPPSLYTCEEISQ